MQIRGLNISDGILKARRSLLHHGYSFQSQSWQGVEQPPVFLELLNLDLTMPMYDTQEEAEQYGEPDLPWANDHFLERVGGEPLNPPPSHSAWLTKTEDYFSTETKFSHSYPERLWPTSLMPNGIRFETADLSTAVRVLKADPTTRQCYIPIFFPEDLTAAEEKERVPCTLGWHFMIRKGLLHCFYPMRSCDALRHFQNDLYFANRLCLWLIEQTGLDVTPGELHFHATSFHCFENDKYTLQRKVNS